MSDPVRAIADAVLYEGYVLWPYRRSALKNQQRWTFGGVYPPPHAERHPDDRGAIRAQVLLEGGDRASVGVTLRFLHVVRRQVVSSDGPDPEPVDELTVDGERHLSWDEAVEREVALPAAPLAELARGRSASIAVAAGAATERLGKRGEAGAVVRSWRPLRGCLELSAERLGERLHRVTVSVENSSEWRGAEREDALRQTFCSAHAVLCAEGADFASLTDPPSGLGEAAAGCANEGVWPVLVGEPGDRSRMLASPIILEDYPRVAPESPGELFDGGEIDQLLSLSILALTDSEKEEMRASDPRVREILERTEGMSGEELMRLHGTIRERRALR